MPGLTIDTDAARAPPQQSQSGTVAGPRFAPRSSSPPRPPVSPITPTLGPANLPHIIPPFRMLAPSSSPSTSSQQVQGQRQQQQVQQQSQPTSFAAGRLYLTHTTQPDQSAPGGAVPPLAPLPDPVDFDANPDALALKSAISILQLQHARAARDIQALGRAKEAALARPGSFIQDLLGGRVRPEGDALFAPSAGGGGEEDEDEEDGAESGGGGGPSRKGNTAGDGVPSQPPEAWTSLPRPQNVVRCPPVNWARYAVVGDSLDKLHAEQLARPTEGVPNGRYEFTGGGGSGSAGGAGLDAQASPGPATDGVGGKRSVAAGVIAAPYTPGKDRLDKKAKGPRR